MTSGTFNPLGAELTDETATPDEAVEPEAPAKPAPEAKPKASKAKKGDPTPLEQLQAYRDAGVPEAKLLVTTNGAGVVVKVELASQAG